MRLVLISDTHLRLPTNFSVPDGDVLIHAGDATMGGSVREITAFMEWFANQPHKTKIMIAGNHDWLFETDPTLARSLVGESCIYLQDSGVELAGLRIWGSPRQPWFLDWAFNNGPEELRAWWAKIPGDIDVLLTHGPPRGILDVVRHNGDHVGCPELLARVKELPIRLHVFGHLHHGYGTLREGSTLFVNACTCDEDYAPVNPPVVIDLPDDKRLPAVVVE